MASFYGRSYQVTTIDEDDYLIQDPDSGELEEAENKLLKDYYTAKEADTVVAQMKSEAVDAALAEARKLWVCVTVLVPEQIDLTVTNGEYTYTFDELVEDKTFYLPVDGKWDFSGVTKEGKSISATLNAEPYKFYTVELKNPDDIVHVVGVVWDYSNPDTALTRLTPSTDPLGVVTEEITEEPGTAGEDDASASSPFDNLSPWKDMIPTNIDASTDKYTYQLGEDGFSYSNETVIPIVKFYYKVVDDADNSKRYWYVSDKKVDGFSIHPGSGRAVSRYWVDKNFKSITGANPVFLGDEGAPSIDECDANFKELYDNSWAFLDYTCYCAILLLMLIEFADFDIPKKIWGNYSNNNDSYSVGLSYVTSADTTNGITDIKSSGTGWTYDIATTSTKRPSTAFQYRWIENLGGGGHGTYLGGLRYIAEGIPYGSFLIRTNPSLDVPVQQYYKEELELMPENKDSAIKISAFGNEDLAYSTKLFYSEECPWVFLGTNNDGSNSTYVPDEIFIGENCSFAAENEEELSTDFILICGFRVWSFNATDNGAFSFESDNLVPYGGIHTMFTPTGSWIPEED